MEETQYNIKIRKAKKRDAEFIGTTVAEAIGPEICRDLAEDKDVSIVYRLFSELAARDDSQYSYRNALMAENDKGEVVGAIVAYDGANLIELRKAFIEKANELLGWSMTPEDAEDWEPETNAGEVYIDSLYVTPEYRKRGVASALINGVIEEHKGKVKPFGILCEPENQRAYRLYTKLGFEKDGVNRFAGVPMNHLRLQIEGA